MVRGARGGDEEVGGAEGGAGVSVLLFFSLSLIRRGARAHTPHPRGKFGGGVYFLFFFHQRGLRWGWREWWQAEAHARAATPTESLSEPRMAADSLAMSARSSANVLHARTDLISSLHCCKNEEEEEMTREACQSSAVFPPPLFFPCNFPHTLGTAWDGRVALFFVLRT